MVSKIDKKRDLCRIVLIENNVHKSHYLRQHQKIVANLLVGDVATAVAASYSLMKNYRFHLNQYIILKKNLQQKNSFKMMVFGFA